MGEVIGQRWWLPFSPPQSDNYNNLAFGGGRALGNDTFELFFSGASAVIGHVEVQVSV